MRRNLTKQQTNKNRSREKSFRRAARYVDWSLNLDLFAIHTSMYTSNTYSYTRMQILRTLFLSRGGSFRFRSRTKFSQTKHGVFQSRKFLLLRKRKKTTALLYSSDDDECRHWSTKVDVSMNLRKKEKLLGGKARNRNSETVYSECPKKKHAKYRGAKCILFFFYIPRSRESRGKERT